MVEPRSDVRAVCAVGQRGQLGLSGRMPWEGDGRDVFARDVERFWALTRGHVLLAGPATFASIPGAAFEARRIVPIRSTEPPGAVLARFPGRRIFVGGGIAVWTAYAPFIGHWDITRLPYDGDADRWFDPAWLIAPSPSPNAPDARTAR